jgi:hypothetical protein
MAARLAWLLLFAFELAKERIAKFKGIDFANTCEFAHRGL